MLTAKCGDPNIVGRNWGSCALEFGSKSCIGGGCPFVYTHHPVAANRFRQPFFVTLPFARLPNPVQVLT